MLHVAQLLLPYMAHPTMLSVLHSIGAPLPALALTQSVPRKVLPVDLGMLCTFLPYGVNKGYLPWWLTLIPSSLVWLLPSQQDPV